MKINSMGRLAALLSLCFWGAGVLAQTAVSAADPVIKDCDVCPEMVVISEGSFTMGSNEYSDESPPHGVTIKSFAIGRTEVTQRQWKAVMGSNPSHFNQCGDDCPVDSVAWDDVQAFIEKLNARTTKSYRLPSEAEWEYACRTEEDQAYCGSDDLDSVAVYGRMSGERTMPVAAKQANARGLYDMSGNVWEWTQDCWNKTYSGAPTDGSAWTAGDCAQRVLRGGSWNYIPIDARATNRSRHGTAFRFNGIGFRLARMLEPADTAWLTNPARANAIVTARQAE